MAVEIVTHSHEVIDDDRHFLVDPDTKQITPDKSDVKIAQHSRNSERLTFEIPSVTVEGHDMTKCNKVEIHFRNVDAKTGEESIGIYQVKDEDILVEGEALVISWLVDWDATVYAGELVFSIHYICMEGDQVVYDFPTITYTGLSVGATVWNNDTIAKQYPDIITEFEERISALEKGGGGNSGGNVDFSSLDLAFVNGKLYITVNGATVGNGVEIGSAEAATYYNIVLNLTNCVSSNAATTAKEHSEYTTVISAEESYIMNKLSVTMGGETLTPTNGTIHIEDVTGEIQITASAIANTGGVDLSGIVAWYQTDVQDAYNYVAGMDSTEWVHHVVLADTHYGYSQYGNSMEIVTALMNTGRFDKFIHLGDIVDVLNDNNWQGVLDDGYENHNGNMLYVYGNHEGNVSSDTLTTDVYKTALLSKANFTWFDGDDYCYYYDDTERKIRYVCLNLWAGAENVTAQIAWLNNLLAEMTADWTVFVLVHGTSTDSKFYNGLLFSDVNVGGIIEGHWHVDRLLSPRNVKRVRLLCDRGSNPGAEAGEEDFAPTERVQGTNSEHAITIMSINPTERQVKFYRIGAYAEYYQSVFPNILEYAYDAGDSVYWNDGYWTIDGAVKTDYEGYKYETQLRELKANTPLYVYCSSGENTLSDLLVVTYNSKNLNDFNKRIGNADGKVAIEDALSLKFGVIMVKDNDCFVSVSFDGWRTGEYAVTDNIDDFKDLFADNPTVWKAGYIDINGKITNPDSDTVAYSNTIKVKPNTTYTLGSTTNALTWYGIGMYKAPYTESSIKRVTTATFTTTEDCNFVILSATGVLGNEDTITFEEVTS